ncbi:alpha/beta hydrolase [Altericroceibacterium endophyticum]|uniref:alpha/beta hydrolase n=1 Tax=Altericroceibacterium endophyticum TaxID=1808508 RepID=UPI001F456259|nr:alpha/beta hydrolase fold domain-containing protein [Altericroceibacterium endophyticum]
MRRRASGGRKWHWATYVTRPTITIFRPTAPNNEDAQRAMGLLRQHATNYGIDSHKIGVIGFSAGAYLAANMSNTFERSYKLTDAAYRISARPDLRLSLIPQG